MLRKTIALILQKILPRSGYTKLRDAFRRTGKFVCYRLWFPMVYRLHARKPVCNDRVLFIELHDQKKISDNYQLIWEELSEHYDYDLELFILNKPKQNRKAYYKRCAELTARAAGARYIFLDDAFQVFGHVPIRKETSIYNVWHACGAFKRFGFGTAELKFGADRKTQEKYPNYTFCTEFYVSAPEVVKPYAESTGLPEERVVPLGTSRTDIFYRDSFRAAAQDKLRLFFPSSEGKKVILYAPTFRGRVASPNGNTAFSIPLFHEALSDDYVLICKYHPFIKNPPPIPEKYQDFAVDFTGIMTIEELLCVADICITDYSSLIFEYALFTRPMIFFAYDLETYGDWRGFYYNYDELTPGPVFRRNREMIDYIRHIDERFDPQQVINFRNRFMSACDGHVTTRLMERVFGEELASHRLQAERDHQPAESSATGGGHCDDNAADDETRKAFEEAAARSEAIRQEIAARFSAMKGKRVAAYFMKDEPFCSYPPCNPYADWVTLLEEIPGDMAVIYRHWGERKDTVPHFDSSVFCDCGNTYSREEMAAAADVIVTHCDADVVRYTRNKPVYVFIPEYRWFCRSVTEYEESTAALRSAGVWCETTEELTEALHRPYPLLDHEWLVDQIQRLEEIYKRG